LGSLDTPEYEASQFLLVVATYKTKTSTFLTKEQI
jgi:hypothetical protein